jgi:hypothetical protein
MKMRIVCRGIEEQGITGLLASLPDVRVFVGDEELDGVTRVTWTTGKPGDACRAIVEVCSPELDVEGMAVELRCGSGHDARIAALGEAREAVRRALLEANGLERGISALAAVDALLAGAR